MQRLWKICRAHLSHAISHLSFTVISLLTSLRPNPQCDLHCTVSSTYALKGVSPNWAESVELIRSIQNIVVCVFPCVCCQMAHGDCGLAAEFSICLHQRKHFHRQRCSGSVKRGEATQDVPLDSRVICFDFVMSEGLLITKPILVIIRWEFGLIVLLQHYGLGGFTTLDPVQVDSQLQIMTLNKFELSLKFQHNCQLSNFNNKEMFFFSGSRVRSYFFSKLSLICFPQSAGHGP